MDQKLIQFKNATKSFGDVPVLEGINLSIYKGEITSIVGKSGTGKSVLLKHIIGLLEPDSGQVLYEGKSLAAMKKADRKALKRKFSYLFQDTALFDFLTVFENIALPLKETTSLPDAEIGRRVRDQMLQLDLKNIDLSYPSQLSGGMKKRVALARALVTNPEIVLFDEPTTGLDPIRKNAVHSMISDYQKRFGFTAVIVSHEIPDVFFISQRVAMIDGGRIIFEGTPEEIQQVTTPAVKSFIQGLESPHDDLTGIASQAMGQRRLKQEMNRLQRHQIPFSIVLLSVDTLEDIDRIAGHMASQTMFKTFAHAVKQNIYITDTCFRYDLNKILIVLPDTDTDQAGLFCRKLSRNLETSAILEEPESDQGFCFSVNAGIAQAKEDSRLESLLAEVETRQNIFYECRL
ncbi:MAG: ATP-binding cassette domain-containing protein [Desulfobacterales bacterium]|nr:ATP-binding cassette domain-containing protein [Desulfobacterales bacterium]